ncbi:MAG: protoporphyrinogen oxidase HemJ [Steroidobacteraceae bacterium]
MLALWLKAFHIIGVVTWFAGLFYLPRLFVYHAAAGPGEGPIAERFAVMERRLFVMMTIGGALAIAFGIAMVAEAPAYLQAGWLHAKLGLVLLLVIYHIWCFGLMRSLKSGRSKHSDRWYRIFNEIPGLLLIGIVILAVVKPF